MNNQALLAWFDAFQQRHGVLGFPIAVQKKYVEDGGRRHASLITYYGFLSLFPILLLATTLLTTFLVNRVQLREEIFEALVPVAVQPTVNAALEAMPTSGLPLLIGLVALLLSSMGVVRSAYETLNHLAGVPVRVRYLWFARYARILLMVVVVLAGGLGVAVLTVISGALPDIGGLQRVSATAATALVIFLVLATAGTVLLPGPWRMRHYWMAAAAGATVVALGLTFGARLLAVLVERSGPVYGTFATVAGLFALFYLVSQTLIYTAEAAVVRQRRLWPRSLDRTTPAAADREALTRVARIQERAPTERIEVRFDREQGSDQ